MNCLYVLCELNSTTQLLTSYIDTHPTVLLTVPCTNVPVYSVQFCFTRVVLFVVTCISACVETVSHISRHLNEAACVLLVVIHLRFPKTDN